MIREQVMPAFICSLLAEGVSTGQVYRAVNRVAALELGQSYARPATEETGLPERTVAVFVQDQAARLGRL